MTKNHLFSSDAGLRRIKPPKSGRDVYKDASTPGLTLNVGTSGARVWYGIVKNHQGKTERQKIGYYLPDSDEGVSLVSARATVERARERARNGQSPWKEYRGELDNGFPIVRDRFMTQYVGRNLKPNTQKAYQSALNGQELTDWQHKAVTDITKGDVLALMGKIVERGKLVQANRTLAYLRKFFNWCAEQDIIRDGQPIPTDRVKAPLKKEKPRERVLSAAEIKILWDASGLLNYPFTQIIRLMLATGQRKAEVAAMRRSELDGAIWRQTDNKAGRAHLVPLSNLALEIIETAPILPIRNKTLLFTTTGETVPSGFSKAKRQLDRAIAAIEDKPEGAFSEPWQLHDIRRTVTTHMRRLGVAQHVCSRILNHAEKGVTGMVYDQYDMLEEKTAALEAWSRNLKSLVSELAQNSEDAVQ